MSNIFFTSDTHFNHDREFVYGPRGFKTIQEMNGALIRNWNETVGKDDDIYVLGDFFLGTDYDYINEVLDKLNGRIHLVVGNHDTPSKITWYTSWNNIVEIADALRQGHIAYVINTRDIASSGTESDGHQIRRLATDNNVTIFTALDTVRVLLDVLEETTLTISTIDA